MDFFQSEYKNFQRDVYMLIEGTRHASLKYLTDEVTSRSNEFEPLLETVTGDDHDELVRRIADVWLEFADEEKFLRNIGLVALLARLTHALKKMAESADSFVPRKKSSYRKNGDSEFAELFREYNKRFQIDFFEKEQSRVAFIEPLRMARNKIVHEGGRVHPFKHASEVDIYGGEEGFRSKLFQNPTRRWLAAKASMRRSISQKIMWSVLRRIGSVGLVSPDHLSSTSAHHSLHAAHPLSLPAKPSRDVRSLASARPPA